MQVKGLLLKDWYMLKSIGRTYLVILALFLFLSGMGSGNMLMTYYPCILSVMLVVSLIAYDEREKWNVYAQTLPYTKAQMVSSKYIISLCISGGCALAVAAVQMAVETATPVPQVAGILIPFALLPSAFLLPFIFKFGVEKGRMLYYAVIAVFCTLLGLIGDLTFNAFWLIVPSCLMYGLSWLLSIKFFEKREW